MAAPNIVYMVNAIQLKDEKSDFYHARTSYNVVDYNNRKSATGESQRDYIGYTSNRSGSEGSFDKNGIMSKQDLKELKRELQISNSVVWDTVISFSEDFGHKNVNDKYTAQKLVARTIDDFFKANNLEPANMIWWGSLHKNTENNHIHLTFFERDPMHVNKNGELEYSFFKLDKKSFDNFKFALAKEIKDNRFEHWNLRDEVRETLAKDFKSDAASNNHFYEEMYKLKINILEEGYSQFSRLSKPLQNKIKTITKKGLLTNPKNLEKYNDYCTFLFQEQDDLIKLHEDNKLFISDKVINFASSRIDDLNNRLFNTTVKTILGQSNKIHTTPTPPNTPNFVRTVIARENRKVTNLFRGIFIGNLYTNNSDGLDYFMAMKAKQWDFEHNKDYVIGG